MKLRYRGLARDVMRSGNVRWRVRVEGQTGRWITLLVPPEHADFSRQYKLARLGVAPEKVASDVVGPEPKGSMAWLVAEYFAYLSVRVKAGTTSAKTLKKKRNLLSRLADKSDYRMMITTERLVQIQDEMAATPAQADAFIEAVKVMYDWAVKRGHVKSNPAAGIERIYVKGDGATPWKAADLKQFVSFHRIGTKAHACASIILWTGCRIEETTILGRANECLIDGVEALRFLPVKKGSSEVIIPFLAPLKAAVRAPKVEGRTYLLGSRGKPYASGDVASAMFKRWCVQAGLPHLSAHGIRKGLAELLAELGCSQYEIMAILGHSEAQTSEVYTRRVERWKLALGAMEKVNVYRAGF
jgi:integrase